MQTDAVIPAIPDPVSDEEHMRAELYGLLATLLGAAPNADVLARCGALVGDQSDLGQAVDALSAAARSAKKTGDEYQALFIGIGRGELLPYASYYMTGFLNERPLAALREDMRRLGMARSTAHKDPEDSIASLMEIMAGLITGRFGTPAPLAVQRDFFNRHIGPWAVRFFSDLETAQEARFYRPVGTIGRIFMTIDAEAFAMLAPQQQEA